MIRAGIQRRFTFWEIVSGLPTEAYVDEHVAVIVDRMAGKTDELRRVSESEFAVFLSIWARFDPEDEEGDTPAFELDVATMEFLAASGCSISVSVAPGNPWRD